jgi:small subunit ribosomal protein S7
MSRKKKRLLRPIKEDYKYKSILVTNYVNRILLEGKKSVAEKLVYDAMDIIKDRIKDDPLKVLVRATENVKPLLQVKARRIGGATYQVPVEVEPIRANSLAIRWIIGFAREKKGKPFAERLAMELMDAYNNQGASIKKREDTHKMAEANRAFAHYKW